MNFNLALSFIGKVLRMEALLMLFPLLVSFIYGQNDHNSFIISIIIILLVSLILGKLSRPEKGKMQPKDGFFIVALSWLMLSIFGCLPFYICGYFDSFVDCFFESASGFTTTGATILTNIEILPKGILLWRSLTHWIGGMGILVFVLALIPSMNGSAVQLLKAESPGPDPGKFVPKISESAKILYIIYTFITLFQIVLLVIAGLPLYDSIITSLGTAGTGGFSNMNASIGAYNNLAVEIIVTVFMLAFGVNFNLYYMALMKNFKQIFKDEEFRVYIIVVVAAMILVGVDLVTNMDISIGEAFRYSSFEVASIITTTGYGITDFNVWPTFSKCVIFALMFLGACAGSTGGGIKVIRILLAGKALKRAVEKIIHPRIVRTVKLNKVTVDESMLSNICLFLFAYFALFTISVFLVSFDNFDLLTTISAVATSVGNVGPCFNVNDFSAFSDFSKIICSICMIAGRLEIFPILILFFPATWKRNSF